MAKKSALSYISVFIQAVIGILLFINLIIAGYAVIAPDSVKKKQISKLTSFGAAKIYGEIKGASYGQVNFSTVNINDGSGSVTVLFGLYRNIEDPVKVKGRAGMKNVSGMKKEQAIKALNRPVYYDSIEVVGIYYPFISMMHAYYINGKISVVEFLMLFMNLVLAAFFFYSVIESLQKKPE